VPEEKLVCVPSAVPSIHYEQPCRRTWFLREFQLDKNAVTVAVIAQFIERKGHRYLLEVLPEITQKFPEVQVLFLGKGPLEEEIKQNVSDSGLGDKIIFAGFRQDLEHILPCLNLVVHPATMEGLGVSLLQAAAAGVPVVAFACGGIPEIVWNGYNGFTVKPGDVNGLKNALCTILKDDKLAISMGNNGRRLVKEHFSVEAMVQGNISVYREVNIAQTI
jgi:glycosyltransferase involved in cell wall biosynthesis